MSFSITLAPPYDLIERNNFFSSNGLIPNVLSSVFVSAFDTDFFRIYYDQARDSEILEELAKLRKLYVETKARSGLGNVPRFLAGLFEPPIIRIHRREVTSMPDKCAPNGICVPGQRRLFVSTSGKFHPCEKIGEAFCIGDVERGLDLVAIRSLIDNYIDISSEDCRNCWAVRLCRLCFVDAKKGTRLDIDRKRERCAQERQMIHEALVNYAEIMEKNPHAFDFVKDMVFE